MVLIIIKIGNICSDGIDHYKCIFYTL